MKFFSQVQRSLWCLGLLAWSAAEGGPRASAAVTLVRESHPAAVVVVPTSANPHESLAARELVEHVFKISGGSLRIEAVDPSAVLPFIEERQRAKQSVVALGRCADARIGASLKNAPRGSFVVEADAGAVWIDGVEEGVCFGVSEVLEQLGVRWFAPGDLCTVIPSKPTVAVKDQKTLQQPSFPSRWFQMPDKEWQVRMRCGGPSFPGAHGIPAPKVSADKSTGLLSPPESALLYALNGEKRTSRQHCISNPQLMDHVVAHIRAQRAKGAGPVIGLGPNDGRGFCECANCRALDGDDFDPFSHEPSVTDRYIWFFNGVLKRLEPDYADTRIAFYIYHSYMRPPVRWKPDPRIMGAVAPIGLDRVHGFSNPVAPERSYAKWLVEQWCRLLPDVYDRGYWSNLACPGFPFIIVHRLRDEIPACHALGLKGWRVETFPNYGPQLPSMYIAARLMWNHAANVDELLRDFHEKFFGPAARPMAAYTELMDGSLRDGDHCTGSSWDMPLFYPVSVRASAAGHLRDAAAAAGASGVYRERVNMVTRCFEMLEHFVSMMDARTRVDFPAAQKALTDLDSAAGELMEIRPVPMLSAGRFSTYVNYMNRFFRPATEQGFHRVSGGNRLVSAAGDAWDFQMDPLRVGESIGLWRREIRGGNWQKILTSSSSWSNQGLRYYKGLAWYRQTLQVSREDAGRRLFLWCGGVDEKAKVWLNGRLLGISHGAAFYPFELDATGAVEAGDNVLTFCIVNEVVNELGTGGIVAPVMLYAPAAGPDAKLDNGRFSLKDTFP